MYFILTITTFIVFALTKSDDRSFMSVFLNLSFLRGFFDDYKLSGIPQGWSLTTEETFYMLAPLFFNLISRSKRYIFVIPVLLMLIGISLVEIFSSKSFFGFFHSFEFMLDYTFFGRCFEFFVGMALAIFYKRISSMKNYRFTYVGVIVIIACIYLLSVMKGNTENEVQYLSRAINYFFLPLGGVSLFFLGLLREKTFISKILGSKTFVLLGKSSYVFYLIHIGVIATFVQSLFSSVLLIFLILVLISIALFKLVEEPLNLLLRKKWQA
jgi:peptidoglycan/LPS O-acetylase OafA/YrhL